MRRAIFLTKWQEWWDCLRREHKFHCDLLLPKGWRVVITLHDTNDRVVAEYTIPAPPAAEKRWVKVHLAAAHEGRDSLSAD